MTRALYCVVHVVCVTALFAATLSAATAEPKRVLLINSYGREFAPWNEYAKEIRSELQDEWEGPLDIYELSLTAALLGQGERDFASYLHTLFSDREPDIILTAGSSLLALRLLVSLSSLGKVFFLPRRCCTQRPIRSCFVL
jgi:hypothetical protein